MSIFDKGVQFPGVDLSCGMEPSLKEILTHYYSQVFTPKEAESYAQKYIDLTGVESEIALPRAEADALRVDAMRYRWLSERNDWDVEPRVLEEDGVMLSVTFCSPKRMDRWGELDDIGGAIDAAMRADA